MPKTASIFLVGTAKGLIVYQQLGESIPALHKIHFSGFSVNMLFVDERNRRWWAGISHKHWGQKLHYSDDLGESWQSAVLPRFNGELMPNGKPAGVRCIQLSVDNRCKLFGSADRPDFCARFSASPETCGDDQAQAIQILTELQRATDA